MVAKFVTIDDDTPLLLLPDLRDWVPASHLVHFIMDAVAALDLATAKVNERGTGSAQYPPSLMLGLLIYSYATGTLSRRRLETLTHENVAARYLCASTHPDHDSICKFRRENKELLSSAFHQVLELAASTGVLQVGGLTVAIDGTKPLAHASKHRAMSHERLAEQMTLASAQITELLAKAEDADSTSLQDRLTIPEEVRRREDRLARLQQAKAELEARAQARFAEESAAHAAVDTATRLIVGERLTNAPNDKEQLQPTVASLSPAAGQVSNVLTDSSFYSEAAVATVEAGGEGPVVYAAQKRQPHGRRIAQLEKRPDPPAPPAGAPLSKVMAPRLATTAGAKLYERRKQTVEPVFGIIKEALGLLRAAPRRSPLRCASGQPIGWLSCPLGSAVSGCAAWRKPAWNGR